MWRKLWPTAERMTLAGVSCADFEVVASEVTFGLQVADDGLDGGAAAPLALDDTEDAALIAKQPAKTNAILAQSLSRSSWTTIDSPPYR